MASYAGLTFDIPKDYEHYVDNKKPEFTSKFPLGMIPALETPDGLKLTESSAIARFGELLIKKIY